MRKWIIAVFVIVACLLPYTIIFGQTNPDDSVIATLTRKLLAQETRIAQQDYVIQKMSDVILTSTDTTLVQKLKAFNIKVQND